MQFVLVLTAAGILLTLLATLLLIAFAIQGAAREHGPHVWIAYSVWLAAAGFLTAGQMLETLFLRDVAAFFGKKTLANRCLIFLVVQASMVSLDLAAIPLYWYQDYPGAGHISSLVNVLRSGWPLFSVILLIWYSRLVGSVRRVIQREMVGLERENTEVDPPS